MQALDSIVEHQQHREGYSGGVSSKDYSRVLLPTYFVNNLAMKLHTLYLQTQLAQRLTEFNQYAAEKCDVAKQLRKGQKKYLLTTDL